MNTNICSQLEFPMFCSQFYAVIFLHFLLSFQVKMYKKYFVASVGFVKIVVHTETKFIQNSIRSLVK